MAAMLRKIQPKNQIVMAYKIALGAGKRGTVKALLGVGRFLAGVVISIGSATAEILMLPIRRESGTVFHAIARFWARTILAVCGIRVTVRGLEKLQRGRNYVYVSNHASMFDIPAILASIPDQIRIVYKTELEVIPIFGWGLTVLGFPKVDRQNSPRAQEQMRRATETIRDEPMPTISQEPSGFRRSSA